MDISLLGFSAVRELFNIHPMFVHFPVALLPAAFLMFGLGIVLKKNAVERCGPGLSLHGLRRRAGRGGNRPDCRG